MCDFGIDAEAFNPHIMYVLKQRFCENDKIVYHKHDFTSLFYILSGNCTYLINDELYPVRKGDIIVCNPGVMHGKTTNLGEDVLEFQVGFSNIHLDGLPKDFLIPPDVNPVIRMSKHEQDFIKCCSDILAEQEKHEAGTRIMIKVLAMKLLVTFLQGTVSDISEESEGTFNFESYEKVSIVNTIVSHINENYMKNISLNKISRNTFLSPVYISKIFREETGESPINYLIKVRLAKASDLLKDSSMSIKGVSKSVGYDDAYHFSKLFKKYYGVSPSEHRII